ncbi:MAG: hypothetical protein LBJ08_04735 [Bifidobacteriaceae bacterium]|nr:hypothetical protein [Bifidobacteriaceae bacterium]
MAAPGVLGLGVCAIVLAALSATVWRPADTVTASVTAGPSGRVLATVPGLLEAQANTVELRVTTPERTPLVVAIGRDTDVAAWIGTTPATWLTGLTSRTAFATGPSADGGATAGEPAPPGVAKASDLWLASKVIAGEGTLTWERHDGRWSLLVAPAGSDAAVLASASVAGATVSLTWPQTPATPFLVPGLALGSVLLAVGAALSVWRHRGRGAPSKRPRRPGEGQDASGPGAIPAPPTGPGSPAAAERSGGPEAPWPPGMATPAGVPVAAGGQDGEAVPGAAPGAGQASVAANGEVEAQTSAAASAASVGEALEPASGSGFPGPDRIGVPSADEFGALDAPSRPRGSDRPVVRLSREEETPAEITQEMSVEAILAAVEAGRAAGLTRRQIREAEAVAAASRGPRPRSGGQEDPPPELLPRSVGLEPGLPSVPLPSGQLAPFEARPDRQTGGGANLSGEELVDADGRWASPLAPTTPAMAELDPDLNHYPPDARPVPVSSEDLGSAGPPPAVALPTSWTSSSRAGAPPPSGAQDAIARARGFLASLPGWEPRRPAPPAPRIMGAHARPTEPDLIPEGEDIDRAGRHADPEGSES